MTTYEEAFDGTKSMSIYLDSSATTRILPEVYDKMEPYIKMFYGNASSHYNLGEISKRAIEEAREIIASAIGCSADEIYFTSGGTEANNWVIKGLKNKYRFRPMHIISTKIEHHSILESLKYRWNEIKDIEYSLVSPDEAGIILIDHVTDLFKLNTELVSVMAVNNELGTIQPIKGIGERCQDNGIIMHTDAVQAFGQLHLDVKAMCIDMMSIASHKIHGPKGVGALYISKDIRDRMNPLIHGGQQEMGMRAGTENVAGIVGFGKAAEIALRNMDSRSKHEYSLMRDLRCRLSNISGIHFNNIDSFSDPRHLNICIDGIRAEELMSMLDAAHVYVSAGSACASDSGEPSHVLKAIGLTDEEANSSIRISIGSKNTQEDIETFVEYLKQYIAILRTR